MKDNESILELIVGAKINFENLLKTPGGALLKASPHWNIAMSLLKEAEEKLDE